jgi:release factor glutamine methyltransferase
MQLRTALQNAIEHLNACEVGSPQMNAEVLLMFTLGCDRAYFYAHPEQELTADELSRYESVVNERARGVPSQYITGHQEFWGMDFIVNPSVLIPRPETEHIVETVLDLVRDESRSTLKLIDVGTGSGAIALALAKELSQAEVMAVDISPSALDVARANAVRLELDSRVHFAQSDVLASVERDSSFDFVVSNPPYVGLNEADKVQDVVKKFEPKEAVFAGDDGTSVIRRLIPQAHEALCDGGWLLMEIGFSMSRAVMALLGDGWTDVKAIPDLAGIPRVVVARKVNKIGRRYSIDDD